MSKEKSKIVITTNETGKWRRGKSRILYLIRIASGNEANGADVQYTLGKNKKPIESI